MFKRVLASLSKSLGGSKPTPAPQPASAAKPATPAPPPQPPAAKQNAAIQKAAAQAKAAVQEKVPASPEEMCGVTAKMTKDQIGTQLKMLYRRYNRGASSLDAKVRAEADQMLDAIVAMREKTFGEL